MLMKKFLKRCTFALLMCGSPLAVMAEWVTVFSEDFPNGISLNSLRDNGWTFSECSLIVNNGDTENKCLKMGKTEVGGSATTPSLGHVGNATLSFTYGRGSTNSGATLTVSLVGGGSITETALFTPSTVAHTSATLHVTNATASTKIVFSAGKGGVAIDNVVVQMNVESPAPSAPTFSLAEGYYKTAQTVTMNCATDGATIYYTEDGTTPTDESTEYTGAITVSTTKTIKAVAIKGSKASEVTTAWYYIGDYVYANAFTNETGGYKSLTDDNSNNTFTVSNLDIGRSAILTFRMAGRKSANELNLVVWKDNVTKILEQGWTPAKDEWTTATCLITLPNDGSTVTLTISSVDCNIDDVLLVAPPTMALAENADNGSTLVAYNGKIVDVATTRTLRANIWNTLCLPFDVNRSILNAAIGGGETMMRTYSSYADNVMTFASVGDNDVIAAGTPFLLKTSVGCTNPVFRAVTIAATEPQTVTKGNVSFKGIFSPTALQTDGSDLFIGTDNCLYSPGAGTNTMNGLRAYIHTTAGARIGLAFDDETQAIGSVDVAPQPQSVVYTLQGQRTTKARRGLYIQNGKKVILK